MLLIAASLIFYAYGEPVYVLLMIASAFINYSSARLIDRYHKKMLLVINLFLNLGILCVFKYTGFLIRSINDVCHTHITDPGITLPIGISFFTFQALSYVIDVYRNEVGVQKSFWKVLLYISFFPQLIAGPIVKYRDINKEISHRTKDAEEIGRGMSLFIIGLSKKVLLANTVGAAADAIFSASNAQLNFMTAWLGAITYMLQIYYDFSGYSDMAIGLGLMFGFHFLPNFEHPYGAVSIQDFWRKWHISLSSWFKDYLYIPLGGNRKGRFRTVVNKLIVFFFTGLWHGANWTFVIWGLYHGCFLLLEEYIPVLKKLPKLIGHLYTCIIVCVGFVIFNSASMAQACSMIRNMFTNFHRSNAAISLFMQQMTPWTICMTVAALLGAAFVPALIKRIPQSIRECAGVQILKHTGMIVLLIWCMLRISSSTYNPFIYFRF
jgi:alginate O-acetyltransferase complex protein AlgI